MRVSLILSLIRHVLRVRVKLIRPMSHRILVVDDMPDCSKVLVRLLGSYGFTAGVANNGAEAVALLDDFAPHLVILDLHMPVMDGYGFLETARTRPHWPECRVIVFTADHNADEARLRELGVDKVCRKAYVSFKSLMDEITDCLGAA